MDCLDPKRLGFAIYLGLRIHQFQKYHLLRDFKFCYVCRYWHPVLRMAKNTADFVSILSNLLWNISFMLKFSMIFKRKPNSLRNFRFCYVCRYRHPAQYWEWLKKQQILSTAHIHSYLKKKLHTYDCHVKEAQDDFQKYANRIFQLCILNFQWF